MNRRFLISAIGLLVVSFSIGYVVMAEKDVQPLTQDQFSLQKSKTNIGDTAIERLALAVEKLVKILGGETSSETNGGVAPQADLTDQTPSCLKGYLTWPSSVKYKEPTGWSLDMMPPESYQAGFRSMINELIDINGDGLPDYIYAYNNRNGYYYLQQCIYLNTGHNWEKTYRCVMAPDNNYINRYYGDCADMTP